ncbi:FecR family protein [Providencia sneebia]|uniref:Anti-FecI sigma factor FecR n=1 Tax=Providencia sneebia DSM 19967 TaxID=1141660 RepID=K8WIY6_9GAMM|nr:FecR domain-containing protein [Providencia sneebia]EKT59901.1 anti-FecI sigma factor FecR [Providencia sneebia DSM 19967]
MKQLIDNPSEIENTAALWVIKTTSRELTKSEELEFQSWISMSEQHLETYYRARQLWKLTANAAGHQKLIDKKDNTTQKRVKLRHIQRSAAAILFCILSVGAWQYYSKPTPDYYAQIGEILQVTLPDGSVVDLDSGSKLLLDFNEHYRQVNLLSGRAYFAVAPMTQKDQRPFRVQAKNGITQALGTEFSIDEKGDQVNVSVYQHSVKITLNSGEELVVNAGDFTHYQQKIWPTSSLYNTASANWRQGQIIFHQQTLDEVIGEINRYRNKPVILLSNQHTQKISGVFQIKSIDSALANLSDSQGLQLYEIPFLTLMY